MYFSHIALFTLVSGLAGVVYAAPQAVCIILSIDFLVQPYGSLSAC